MCLCLFYKKLVSTRGWLHQVWHDRLHTTEACGRHVGGETCVRGDEQSAG